MFDLAPEHFNREFLVFAILLGFATLVSMITQLRRKPPRWPRPEEEEPWRDGEDPPGGGDGG